MSRGDLAVDDLESISLASHASEDSSAVESKIKGLGEFTRRISKVTNLYTAEG